MKNPILFCLTWIWGSIKNFKHNYYINDLLSKGLKIGSNVTIAPTAYVDREYAYLISIGNNCTISNHVGLIAHDASTFKFTGGYTRIGKIDIKENCYIGEKCTILPGVTIGPNVLIAAGSVVNKDIPPNSCIAGVPARFYAKFSDYINYHKQQVQIRQAFEYAELKFKFDERLKEKITNSVQDGDAYVKGFVGHIPYTLNQDKNINKVTIKND